MNWLTRVRYYAEILKVNYWLIPVAMILSSVVLARLVLLIPSSGDIDVHAARSLFDTVGMASISLAGVTFSITIVALTLASQQFGPRTLRNFLGDRANQYTLGTFVATYAFCLALSGMPDAFGVALTRAAILFTYLSAFHCILVFVLFIHHVANGIRGSNILHNLYVEAQIVLERLIPPSAKRLEQQRCLPDDFSAGAADVYITKAGFVQAIDHKSLLALAIKHDLVIEITKQTGQFVRSQERIARVVGQVSDTLKDNISRCVAIGGVRTPEQDPLYLPERIAEMALRSLSPSLNDPYTAAECVYWLGNLLHYAQQHPEPISAYVDVDADRLRLWVPKMTFDAMYEATIGAIECSVTDDKVLQDALKSVRQDLER